VAGGANRASQTLTEAHTPGGIRRTSPGRVPAFCRTSSSTTFWPGRVKRETETPLVDWNVGLCLSFSLSLSLSPSFFLRRWNDAEHTRILAQRDTGRKERTNFARSPRKEECKGQTARVSITVLLILSGSTRDTARFSVAVALEKCDDEFWKMLSSMFLARV